jgi:hypothetical protein
MGAAGKLVTGLELESEQFACVAEAAGDDLSNGASLTELSQYQLSEFERFLARSDPEQTWRDQLVRVALRSGEVLWVSQMGQEKLERDSNLGPPPPPVRAIDQLRQLESEMEEGGGATQDLGNLSAKELRVKAATMGVDPSAIELARDGIDPRAELISLISSVVPPAGVDQPARARVAQVDSREHPDPAPSSPFVQQHLNVPGSTSTSTIGSATMASNEPQQPRSFHETTDLEMDGPLEIEKDIGGSKTISLNPRNVPSSVEGKYQADVGTLPSLSDDDPCPCGLSKRQCIIVTLGVLVIVTLGVLVMGAVLMALGGEEAQPPLLCAAGQFLQPANAIQATQAACVACGAGKYSSAGGGSSSCIACVAGQYQGWGGGSSCSDCAAGRYSSSGGTACIDCAAGKYIDVTGSDEASDCIGCSAGRHVDVSGSDAASDCIDCHRGPPVAVGAATDGVGGFTALYGARAVATFVAGGSPYRRVLRR